MPFEIYNRKIQIKGVPGITFTKSGRMAFNKDATSILKTNAVEYVVLLWDADKNMVGVRPISKKDPRAYTLRYSKRGQSDGCGFSSVTFFNHIGVDVSKTRTMPTKWVADEGMFVVEIPDEYLKK